MPQTTKPVPKDQRIGCMESVTGADKVATSTDWRCVNCGSIRRTSAHNIKRIVRRDGIGTGCSPCTKKVKADTYKRAAVERLNASHRLGLKNKRFARRSQGKCRHKKCLICVDPGNVEIWRCPICDVTAVPRWTPPRAGNLFPGRGLNKDEQSPSFDNAVRIVEGD